MNRIILASASPRRKQLLEWAEIPFEVIVHPTDESYPEGLSPESVAIHIARNKALAVAGAYPHDTVLAADTIVVLGDRIIGKPAGRDDAIAILGSLSGQVHRVITGVTIVSPGNETSFADITEVSFHELTPEGIRFYIDKYKPYDKAGAYAIQEWIGVTGIQSIRGDFYNVMGLPVSRVVQALRNT
ncbi:MAG: septum formation protein Maf [Chitinophagaceae bacterium]|nr:MAG: septum formation protein Maf [Chitinophagaceae bacterium]